MEPKIVIDEPEVFNKKLLDSIINDGEDGLNKSASEVASGAVRRRLRENGFFRRILPIKPVSEDRLTKSDQADGTGVDNLYVVDYMEPDQPGAVSLPLNDTHVSYYFRGEAFRSEFFKISTPEWTKNIHELKTYNFDLQKMIVDNSLRDVQTHEDTRWLGWVDAVVGAAGGANGAAGVQQHFDYSNGGADMASAGVTNGLRITRANYRKYTYNSLQDRDLNNGVFLVNRKTFSEFADFDRTELGGDKSQDIFFGGPSEIKDGNILGIPHIITLKRGLVADGDVYQFTTPDFLGRAYSLKDVTMYVSRKKDLIRISAEEILAMSIANVAGVNKVTFAV